LAVKKREERREKREERREKREERRDAFNDFLMKIIKNIMYK
jgi:hypothetical protein